MISAKATEAMAFQHQRY